MIFICVTESKHLHMFKKNERYFPSFSDKDKVIISAGIFSLEVKLIDGVWKNEKEDVEFVEGSNDLLDGRI